MRSRAIPAISAAVVLTAVSASAQTDCPFSLKDVPGAPSFSAYAVKTTTAKAVPIRIGRHSHAWLFRTALREAYGHGEPNFAGHYRIAGWGCGTSCINWAVVDVLTGSVYFDPKISEVGSAYAPPNHPEAAEYGFLAFRRDSSLLVTTGTPDQSSEGMMYYVWTEKRFRQIAFVPRTNICQAMSRGTRGKME